MDPVGVKGKEEGEGGSERKRGAMMGLENGIEDEDANMSYSVLMETLNSLSKRMKDENKNSTEPKQQSSIRSTPSSNNSTSAHHALLCDSLDNLLTHYLANYLSGTVEDKLMKNDLENVRSYLRRKKIKKQEDMKRNEVNRPTARRFILNGIRSTIQSQSSNEKVDQQDKDKADDHKKLKLDQAPNNPLPEIRKVIKNQDHVEDESNDSEEEEDLKIYSD